MAAAAGFYTLKINDPEMQHKTMKASPCQLILPPPTHQMEHRPSHHPKLISLNALLQQHSHRTTDSSRIFEAELTVWSRLIR